MNCLNCSKDLKDILCHLNKNEKCQDKYDMDALRENRRQKRLEYKRSHNKNYYEQNKESIRTKQGEYF